MTDYTLGEVIDERIRYLIERIPACHEISVSKVYEGKYVDVSFQNQQNILNYVPTNVSANVGDTGVLVFLDGDINQPFCILAGKGADLSDYYTKEEIDEMIKDIDLKDYVKKRDVQFKVSLEDNGTAIFMLDVGDGF